MLFFFHLYCSLLLIQKNRKLCDHFNFYKQGSVLVCIHFFSQRFQRYHCQQAQWIQATRDIDDQHRWILTSFILLHLLPSSPPLSFFVFSPSFMHSMKEILIKWHRTHNIFQKRGYLTKRLLRPGCVSWNAWQKLCIPFKNWSGARAETRHMPFW